MHLLSVGSASERNQLTVYTLAIIQRDIIKEGRSSKMHAGTHKQGSALDQSDTEGTPQRIAKENGLVMEIRVCLMTDLLPMDTINITGGKISSASIRVTKLHLQIARLAGKARIARNKNPVPANRGHHRRK